MVKSTIVVIALILAGYFTIKYARSVDVGLGKVALRYSAVSFSLCIIFIFMGYTKSSVALLALLLLMSFTDLTTGYILDSVVLCGLFLQVFNTSFDLYHIALTVLLLLLALSKLGNLPFLGTGDVEIFLIILMIKDFWFLVCTLCLASLIALVAMELKWLLTRHKPEAFPFVPYLALAYTILLFTGGQVYVLNFMLG